MSPSPAALAAAIEPVPVAHVMVAHFHHCTGHDDCEAVRDARKPFPAGWKLAHCPCGNPMNAYGDINIDEPAALCPAHPTPQIMKPWHCGFCQRGSDTVVVTEASKLGPEVLAFL